MPVERLNRDFSEPKLRKLIPLPTEEQPAVFALIFALMHTILTTKPLRECFLLSLKLFAIACFQRLQIPHLPADCWQL